MLLSMLLCNKKNKEYFMLEKKEKFKYNKTSKIIIIVLELLFMILAVYCAIYCSDDKFSLYINVFLAIFFPIPYVIAVVVIKPCGKNALSELSNKFNFKKSYN
jgi:hypothetical protein